MVILWIVSGAEKKRHLVEAATFSRLDQMLRMIVQGAGVRYIPMGGNPPQPKQSKNKAKTKQKVNPGQPRGDPRPAKQRKNKAKTKQQYSKQ